MSGLGFGSQRPSNVPVGLDRVVELARGAGALVRATGSELERAMHAYCVLIGRVLEVDSLQLTSFRRGPYDYRLEAEWVRPGFRAVGPQRHGDQVFGQFPWFGSEVMRQGFFAVEDVEGLPEAASAERRHLEWIGRRAVVYCHDASSEDLQAGLHVAMHVAPRVWRPEDIDDLRTATGLLGAALRRLREQRRPLADDGHLFRNDSRALAIIDETCQHFVAVNPRFAELHGYAARELEGEPVRVLAPELMAPHAIAALARVREDGHHVFEMLHRTRGGLVFPGRIEATRLGAADGSTCYLFVVCDRSRESSELAAIGSTDGPPAHNAELQSLGLLAGGIAHDFNNLLVGMLGNADLARMSVEEDGLAAHALDDIRAAATQAAGLAKQMLSYVGKRQLNPEHVDLGRELEEIVGVLRRSLSEKAVVEIDRLPNVVLFADATAIRQVLMNLLLNASDALHRCEREHGTIHMRAGAVENLNVDEMTASFVEGEGEGDGPGFAYVEVQDTGAGMSEGVKRRIFDAFFTTSPSGRGLGMATVLACIRSHSGAIDVQSRQGEGTTIRVYFPRTRELADRPQAVEHPVVARRALEPREGLVLLAEDEEVVRTLLRRLLERRGLRVIEARNGLEGRALFEEHAGIDFALVDVSMPGLDGISLMNSLPAHNPTPIVLMSGYAPEDLSFKGVGGREVHFLQKPFESSELDAFIDQFTRASSPHRPEDPPARRG